MPKIIEPKSRAQRDEQAFYEAANLIDWNKTFVCKRCNSVFGIDRHADERHISIDWSSHGNDGVPDYFVRFRLDCPVCGYDRKIIVERYRSDGAWLWTMKNRPSQVSGVKSPKSSAKQSFWARLFGTK